MVKTMSNNGGFIETTDDDNSDDEIYYGFEENEALRKKGLVQLEEAIQLIPSDEKDAYLEARKRSSLGVFQAESDPLRFLRIENFNSWAAARRLTTYWKQRRDIFGDRAFLPMNLTGEGAMLERDMKCFENGLASLLPSNAGPSRRKVFYMDRSRSAVSSVKAAFCVMQIISEDERSQKEKPIWLLRVNGLSGARFNRHVTKIIGEWIRKGFPMKPPEVHIVCCPPVDGRSTFLEKIIPMTIKHLGSFLSKMAVVHLVESPEAARAKLEKFGFDRRGLPPSLGGTLDATGFVQWQRDRGRSSVAGQIEDLSSLINATLADYAAKRTTVVASDAAGPPALLGEAAPKLAERNRVAKGSPRVGAGDDYFSDQDSISTTEKEIIRADIFGKKPAVTKSIQVTESQEIRGRAQLEEALELIPEKSAFMEARLRVPHLVEQESSPLHYLQAEGYDPWAAASRLVLYWEKRKQCFGARSFLPMTLSGRGALSREDVACLRSGFFQILPDDSARRAVSFHDRSRLKNRSMMDVDRRMRCFFYMFTVLSANESARANGLAHVSFYGDKMQVVPADEHRLIKEGADIVRCGAFPVPIKAVHFVCATKKKTIVDSFLPGVMKLLCQWKFLGRRIVVHNDDTNTSLLAGLEAYGFRSSGLPEAAGGSWTDAQFLDWWEERQRIEEAAARHLGDQAKKAPNARELRGSPRNTNGAPGGHSGPSTATAVVSAEEEEKRAKKRRMDVIYARRKRERQRIEIEVLQGQCTQFREDNDRLREDNARLEVILQTAKAQVSRIQEKEATTSAAPPCARTTPDLASTPAVTMMDRRRGSLPSLDRNSSAQAGQLDPARARGHEGSNTLVQGPVVDPYATTTTAGPARMTIGQLPPAIMESSVMSAAPSNAAAHLGLAGVYRFVQPSADGVLMANSGSSSTSQAYGARARTVAGLPASGQNIAPSLFATAHAPSQMMMNGKILR